MHMVSTRIICMLPVLFALQLASVPASTAAAAAAAATNRTRSASRTLLMVDDHDLLYRAGLSRHLQPLSRPTPGVPVLAPTLPWESLMGYVSVQEVGDKLMMWYQSYSASSKTHPAVAINGSNCFVAVAYSTDRGSAPGGPHRQMNARHSFLQWGPPFKSIVPNRTKLPT